MIKGKIFFSSSLLLKSLGNNNPVHKSVVPSEPIPKLFKWLGVWGIFKYTLRNHR